MSLIVGAPGLRFFRSICLLNAVLITLAGFSYFASAITEEKEEGTLGLLKLADLSALSILLGKSTSRLVAALVVFAGQFPFALLAITLGGVTVHQVMAACVALAAYMVLVANVALLCSVLCRRSGQAAIWMLVLSVLFLGLVPLLHTAQTDLLKYRLVPQGNRGIEVLWRLVDELHAASILTRINTILSTGFSGSIFSGQVVWSGWGAIACFLAAWALFNRFTEYVDRSNPARGMLPRIRSRRLLRVARPWRWALVWKDFHFVAGGPILAAAKVVVYPLLIGLLFWQADVVNVLLGLRPREAAWWAVLMLIAAELLLYATRIFQQEKKWGTLPCLTLLPRSTASLGYAKLGGCLLGSAPTILLIVWLNATMPPAGRTHPDWFMEQEFVASVVIFVLVLHLTAFFSLIVRWGALPLALGAMAVAGTCLVPVVTLAVSAIALSRQAGYAEIAPILYTGGVLSGVLQFLIGVQFRSAAAR
jgi:ABC-type transport system involved in multi-copper enzyme maturation permease subunit